MTTNQIRYLEHQENVRHNQAVEAETARDNMARLAETQRYNTIFTGEQIRTNQANEAIRGQTNAINAQHYERLDRETRRSNLANEDIKWSQIGLGYQQLSEQYRHNVANELNAQNVLDESIRHNFANETETNRSNVSSEDIRRTTNLISARNADTQRGQLEVAQRNAGYTARQTAANEKSIANQNANRTAGTIIAGINAATNLTKTIGGIVNNAQRNEILRERNGQDNRQSEQGIWEKLFSNFTGSKEREEE